MAETTTAGAPPVAIIMGSRSDWPVMRCAAESLETLGVAYEAKVVSAHRTPERMFDFARGAKARGVKVISMGLERSGANRLATRTPLRPSKPTAAVSNGNSSAGYPHTVVSIAVACSRGYVIVAA